MNDARLIKKSVNKAKKAIKKQVTKQVTKSATAAWEKKKVQVKRTDSAAKKKKKTDKLIAKNTPPQDAKAQTARNKKWDAIAKKTTKVPKAPAGRKGRSKGRSR